MKINDKMEDIDYEFKFNGGDVLIEKHSFSLIKTNSFTTMFTLIVPNIDQTMNIVTSKDQ